NQAFAPYQTEQVEAGVKWDLGRFGGGFSVFDVKKPVGSVQVIDDTTAVFVVLDQQRHKGAELSLFGEAARGLKLLGGLSWIDAELSASGKQAIGVPRHQFNIGTEWTPAAWPDLALNARLVRTASQWADAANTFEVPAWTRLDVGARWNTELAGTPLALRLRVDNLLGKDYWASAGGYPGANYLVLGGPRALSLSASVDF
ncbi:MAG: TonB-dependent receptor, partial [Chitinophagaceae bacterium]|nr:TonB-dependent receptor [Rubrivivax sp.]